MKKLLILILLLLAIPAFAGVMSGVIGGSGTVVCSYPVVQSYATGGDAELRILHLYTGGSFTAASNFTLVRVGATLKQFGTAPAVNITAYIFESDEGTPEAPGALIATSTTTVAAQSISTVAYTEYTWDFTGVSITSGQNYFIMLSDAETDASNTVKWQLDDGGVGGAWCYSDGLPTWTNYDDSITPYYSVMSCN